MAYNRTDRAPRYGEKRAIWREADLQDGRTYSRFDIETLSHCNCPNCDTYHWFKSGLRSYFTEEEVKKYQRDATIIYPETDSSEWARQEA